MQPVVPRGPVTWGQTYSQIIWDQ